MPQHAWRNSTQLLPPLAVPLRAAARLYTGGHTVTRVAETQQSWSRGGGAAQHHRKAAVQWLWL